MSRRNTYEYVKNYFYENGCELLEAAYKNNASKMKYRCKCGEIAEISFAGFQRCHGCINCKGTPRLSHEYVKNYFAEQGCVLLENHYLNAHTTMRYKCQCGKITITTWNNYSKGKRCLECGHIKMVDKQRHDLEYINNYFAERGCELLSSNYKNCRTILDYKCTCDNMAKVTFIDFKRGKRCSNCWLISRSGSNHHNWNPNKDEMKLNKLIHNKCSRLLYSSLDAVGRKKETRTSELLGYTRSQLKEHIINHPNWHILKDKKWHLDHIFPINAFVKHKVLDIKIINSLDNLQPLLGTDNIAKGDNCDFNEFKAWLSTKGIML